MDLFLYLSLFCIITLPFNILAPRLTYPKRLLFINLKNLTSKIKAVGSYQYTSILLFAEAEDFPIKLFFETIARGSEPGSINWSWRLRPPMPDEATVIGLGPSMLPYLFAEVNWFSPSSSS